MKQTRKLGRVTRVSNGRVLHLTPSAGHHTDSWEGARRVDLDALEDLDDLDAPLAFRPVLLTPEHEESALQIAAFVGRVLAERRRPTPA